MENKADIVQNLLDMGFSEAHINQAIQSTNSTNIEVLITFLEQVQNQTNEQPQDQNSEQQSYQEQTQSISGHVNQEDVGLLLSLGYSKNVSEKALLMTQNVGKDKALEWIEQHKNDPDFEEELRMMSQQSKMSPEEAAIKARELSRQIREKWKNQEEKDTQEREKNRLKSGKQMTDARREIDEMKRRHDADLNKKQRQEDQIARQQMLDQLQRDKEARFGKKFEGQQDNQQVQKQKVFSPLETFTVGIKQIKIAQPPQLVPDVAAGSLGLIVKIIENILKNPSEQKFRKISLTSQAYQNKIDQVFGAKNALDSLGFVEQDGFYQCNCNDLQLLDAAHKVAQEELRTI